MAKTNQIRISYLAPKNPAHQSLYEALKAAGVLERVQTLMSPLRLPAPLLLKLEGCDGVANAWYEEGAVTVCYEYVDEIVKNAQKENKPAGVTQRAALVGPIYDVFFHEIAHALFDVLQVPLLGREEDAADDLSAYLMLQFNKEEARELIAGTAYSYAAELKLHSAKDLPTLKVTFRLEKFADEHATPAQRLYDLLCNAYGADPTFFAWLIDVGWLPRARAEGCESEYQQVAFAYRSLIGPHVDPTLLKKVREGGWLPVPDAPPPHRHPAPSGESP